MSQMVELADKDTSIMPFIFRKVEEVNSMVKETEVLRHPASAFGHTYYMHISLHMHTNLHIHMASTPPHSCVCVCVF